MSSGGHGTGYDHDRRMWLAGACLAGLSLTIPRAVVAADDALTRFSISRQDDEFLIEGALSVSVPPSVAWAVLVDYDHMHEFVPNMHESRVLTRDGTHLRVVQKGVMPFGPFNFPYDVERDVHLQPETVVVSRGVRGNMRKVELLTELEAQGEGVRIHHRAAIVPDFWVPPLLGPRLLRSRAEAQFDALVAEMRRRAALAAR